MAAAILRAAGPADRTPARAYLLAFRWTWPPLGIGPDLPADARCWNVRLTERFDNRRFCALQFADRLERAAVDAARIPPRSRTGKASKPGQPAATPIR